jgi:Family of unknown function (DUF6801)
VGSTAGGSTAGGSGGSSPVASRAGGPGGSKRSSVLIGALVLVAGVLAGTAGIAAGVAGTGRMAISVNLTYSCQFPSGTFGAPSQAVSVDVAATFPAAANVGEKIQPTAAKITATLPQTAVAGLRQLGASTVAGTGVLSTLVDEHGQSGTAQWLARTSAAAPVPASGDLRLAEPATAVAAVVGSSGTVTISAGGLVLNLTPRRADGTATSPPSVRAQCSPPATGRLAAIPVAASSSSASPAASPSASSSSSSAASKKFPPGCGKIKAVGTGVPTCGYITGFSDVAKLFGAALLQPAAPAKPGLVNVDFAEHAQFINHGKDLRERSTAELFYKGKPELPPVRATFLSFRFIPVTATLRLIELTPIKIVSVSGVTGLPFPISVRASSKILVRVSDVTVNGTPLNVGTQCRTAAPVNLVLVGKGFNTLPPKGYTVSTGGPLAGTITIPPFIKCGVSENLDPLLTGSISGPGNFVKMTQGKLCGPSQPANWTCPPPPPKPLR